MADIEITCPQCGKTVMVSEFADPALMTCRTCKAPFKAPAPATLPQPGDPANPRKGTDRIRVQPTRQSPVPTTVIPDVNAGTRVVAKVEHKADVNKTVHVSHNLYSWLLFIVLATIGAYFRYGGGLTMKGLDILADYGPWLAVIFHVIVVLKSFKDSILQGVLCAIVPLYSLYYLFSVSDDFYLRAIAGGCLVAVGEDSGYFFSEIAGDMFRSINHFISTGGGYVR